MDMYNCTSGQSEEGGCVRGEAGLYGCGCACDAEASLHLLGVMMSSQTLREGPV